MGLKLYFSQEFVQTQMRFDTSSIELSVCAEQHDEAYLSAARESFSGCCKVFFFFSSVGLASAYANWPDVDAGSGSE